MALAFGPGGLILMLGIFMFISVSGWCRDVSSRSLLFNVVDLCLLQLAGVVDVDRFPLAKYVVHGCAGLSMAVAGVFHAAEGKMDFSTDRRPVDISDSGFDIPHSAERPLYIASINRAGKTVGSFVENFDGFFEALHFNHGEHGTKDFFLRDAHRRSHLVKDRRPIEITIDPFSLFIDRPADE